MGFQNPVINVSIPIFARYDEKQLKNAEPHHCRERQTSLRAVISPMLGAGTNKDGINIIREHFISLVDQLGPNIEGFCSVGQRTFPVSHSLMRNVVMELYGSCAERSISENCQPSTPLCPTQFGDECP